MSESNFQGKAAAFIGTAAQKARDLAASAAKGTKKLGRITKLNMEIAAQKDTVRHAYTDIGKLYYEAHRDDPEGFFIQLCQEIDTAMAAIEEKEAEIAALKSEISGLDSIIEDDDLETVVSEAEAEAGIDPDIEVTIEVEECSAEDAPAEDAPVEDAPAEDAPVEDAPAEDAPVEDAPAEDAPVEEAPVEDAPAEEAPVEEAPVEEAPVEDAPVEDAPVEDAPVEE